MSIHPSLRRTQARRRDYGTVDPRLPNPLLALRASLTQDAGSTPTPPKTPHRISKHAHTRLSRNAHDRRLLHPGPRHASQVDHLALTLSHFRVSAPDRPHDTSFPPTHTSAPPSTISSLTLGPADTNTAIAPAVFLAPDQNLDANDREPLRWLWYRREGAAFVSAPEHTESPPSGRFVHDSEGRTVLAPGFGEVNRGRVGDGDAAVDGELAARLGGVDIAGDRGRWAEGGSGSG